MKINLVNNLGTVLYTMFFGKEVGKDSIGNRYFISKNKPIRKWVLYKNEKNPTIIPVNWQFWLTDDEVEFIPSEKYIKKKYSWEKNRLQNNTGTVQAYHPAKALDKKQVTTKQKKYKNWTPS